MELMVDSQAYSSRLQLGIDACLRCNLKPPGTKRMVLFCERDAPPVTEGTVQVEVVSSDKRITYAEGFRWAQCQGSAIGLRLNAHNYLDEWLVPLCDQLQRGGVSVDHPADERACMHYLHQKKLAEWRSLFES